MLERKTFTRGQWLALHFGTLAVTFFGWVLIAHLTQSLPAACAWLMAGIFIFVNLPSKERIR